MNPYLADLLGQSEELERTLLSFTGPKRDVLEHAAKLLRSIKGRIYLTGMGASYFACAAARSLLDHYGVFSVLEDTSYLVDYRNGLLTPDDLLLVVSQSGESIEAKRLVSSVDVPLILVTNHSSSTVAARAQVVIDTGITDDHSVAIKTYTVSTLVLYLIIHTLVGRLDDEALNMKRAVESAQTAIAAYKDRASEVSSRYVNTRHIMLLGRGASVASALEGALLFKEGAKIPAEGMNAGQFRHGGVEVVESGTRCILFIPRGCTDHLSIRLAEELEGYGASTLIVTDSTDIGEKERRDVWYVDSVDEYVAPLIEIIPIQWLAYAVAKGRGVEPGSFRNTTPVITSE